MSKAKTGIRDILDNFWGEMCKPLTDEQRAELKAHQDKLTPEELQKEKERAEELKKIMEKWRRNTLIGREYQDGKITLDQYVRQAELTKERHDELLDMEKRWGKPKDRTYNK